MNKQVGETVYFTNASTLHGYPATSFTWNFGDGSHDTTNWDTSHEYDDPGTYVATLTVTTAQGTCTPYSETITVTEEGEERTPPCGNYGDIDNDGYVTQNDVQMVTDYLNNVITFTPDQIIRADVNGNGSVDISDLSAIQSYVDGTINTFPICDEQPTGGIDPMLILATAAILGALIMTQR